MSDVLEILVDGDAGGERWTQDRSLQYGDGLFETMQVRGGRIRFELLHAARLARGCKRLAIHADHKSIWSQAGDLAQRHGTAVLKLHLSRGDATARGYTPSGAEKPRLILSVFAPPLAGELPSEIRAATSVHRLGENPDLAGIKHCNRLEQVLARASLHHTGAFEGLMASSSGLLISGTMSNVFLELDGELVTPVLERCGIEGVLRAVVLREARQMGIAIRVTDIPMAALPRCRSLAISNARVGLLQVQQLDGRTLRRSEPLQALATRIDGLEE